MDRRKSMVLWLAVLMVLSCASMGWAATVNGFVNYTGSKSGRVYLLLSTDTSGDSGYGVSIPVVGATPVSFTIRGVPQNGYDNYTLSAFMDTQGNGIHHANDPAGKMGGIVVNASTMSVGTLTLADPAPVVPEAGEIVAYRGNGGNMVLWNGYETDEGAKKANRYRISWSIDNGATVQGYVDRTANDDDMYLHLNGGASHSYQVMAIGAGTPGTDVSTAWKPVEPSTGGVTVSGTVNLGTVTPTGPLAVILADESGEFPVFLVHVIQSPSSSEPYSFTNVPAGTYGLHAVIDMNNNSTFDVGDISFQPDEYMSPVVTVGGAPVTGPTISFTSRNADVLVTTAHGKSSDWSGDYYSIGLRVDGQLKSPVNVAVSRLGVLETTDIGFNRWGSARIWFPVQTPPQVGDTYSFNVQYSDGTTEDLTNEVNAVLNSFPQPVAPVGLSGSNPLPTFSWTAPPQPPAGPYAYNFWLGGQAHADSRDVWWNTDEDLPSSQLSVMYNDDGAASEPTLPDGEYNWSIQVLDQYGNSAQYQTNFMMTSDPTIGSVLPPGGLPGTSVTISGINFSATPADNTVRFNGTLAVVSAATPTSLTVTVPNGANTGPITVSVAGNEVVGESKDGFIVSAPLTVQGKVQTTSGVNIEGALVQKSDNPSLSTTTAADGSYTLGPFFEGQGISLKITKTGYVPTHTGMIHFFLSSLDIRQYPSHLYSTAEYAGFNIQAGRGAIIGQVLDQTANPFTPVAGVQVSAASSMNMGINIPVTYFNGTTFGGTSTYDNGIFMVANVASYDAVNVEASKPWWHFDSNGFIARADSVTEGSLVGWAVQPTVSSFSPANGIVGTSVTISGSNFSSIPSENVVKFQNNVTATVTAASTNSLTVIVPSGAVSGSVSVTTPGGTNYGPGIFTMNMPTVTSTSPDFGPLGTVVTVSGNFPDTDDNNYRLLFGISQQAIDSITSNSLTFTIPQGVDPVINWSLRYSNQQIHFETFEVKNHLTLNIVGSGTVNDSPNVYTCAAATCEGDFAPVVTLTLVPTPSVGYTFQGWSGACGGTGNCILTMGSAKNATATFSVLGYLKIGNTSYAKIQDAFDVAMNNDSIMIQSLTQTVSPFVENLLLNRPAATIKLKGGYDSVYGTNNSFSVVDGSLKIRSGSLKVERLKIQ